MSHHLDFNPKSLIVGSVNPANKSILFFDGNCVFCNQAARFLIKLDKHKRMYFAPLQGIAAKTIVPLEYRQSLSTAIYHRAVSDKKHILHGRSDAILWALIDMGGFWSIAARFVRLLPSKFRDWCYDRIANNRKHLSSNAACKLPTKEEHARILP